MQKLTLLHWLTIPACHVMPYTWGGGGAGGAVDAAATAGSLPSTRFCKKAGSNFYGFALFVFL